MVQKKTAIEKPRNRHVSFMQTPEHRNTRKMMGKLEFDKVTVSMTKNK